MISKEIFNFNRVFAKNFWTPRLLNIDFLSVWQVRLFCAIDQTDKLATEYKLVIGIRKLVTLA